jgi:hypothetical protein
MREYIPYFIILAVTGVVFGIISVAYLAHVIKNSSKAGQIAHKMMKDDALRIARDKRTTVQLGYVGIQNFDVNTNDAFWIKIAEMHNQELIFLLHMLEMEALTEMVQSNSPDTRAKVLAYRRVLEMIRSAPAEARRILNDRARNEEKENGRAKEAQGKV